MTEKELYACMGADYDDVIGRVLKDELVGKFALMFLEDKKVITDIENALIIEDYNDAFLKTHGLKGVILNLAYTRLERPVRDLTEDLRNGGSEKSMDYFRILKLEFDKAIDIIEEYKRQK